jgi:tetratricopeptide (TPR) repeat protein
MRRLLTSVLACSLLALLAVPSRAENEGQADLDKATELQLTAETLGDLEKVIELGESALKKGLDKGQTELAKQILAATLYQHADRMADGIFEQTPPSPRWPVIRTAALRDIDKAKGHDASLPDLYLLEAKLQMLPGGDEKAAGAAIDEAVKLLKAKDDSKQLAQALVLRAAMTDDNDKKLADYDAAIKADPENAEAWQARALLYIERGDSEKAVADLTKLVETQAGNPLVVGALAEALTNLKKYDEALKYCEQVITLAPKSTLGYNLRARTYEAKNEIKLAIKDLDQALQINANDLSALLTRARLNAAEGNDDQAKLDIEKALEIDPDRPQAILLRALLSAAKQKFGAAIADVQVLLQDDPTNAGYRLQLALFYVGDKRPRKAIELLTSILDGISDDTDDDLKQIKTSALQSRGDALLSVGKHAEAVEDYEQAIKLDPEDTGLLNNYAWVLATSTDDKVRNADRSIELGTKACELTKYERPHILSTLAAGYAEKGDWENAIKWSTKAVEVGSKDAEVGDQLKKELDSYKEKKPWREKQEIEENTKPLGGKSSDLET